jgi:hypothetical protein
MTYRSSSASNVAVSVNESPSSGLSPKSVPRLTNSVPSAAVCPVWRVSPLELITTSRSAGGSSVVASVSVAS